MRPPLLLLPRYSFRSVHCVRLLVLPLLHHEVVVSPAEEAEDRPGLAEGRQFDARHHLASVLAAGEITQQGQQVVLRVREEEFLARELRRGGSHGYKVIDIF